MRKLAFVVVVGCLVLSPGVVAQEDPSAEDLIEKMTVSFESEKPMLTLSDRVLLYGGKELNQDLWEVWSRGKGTFRAEKGDGTLVIRTEERIDIYVPSANAALTIPKEAIDEVGDGLSEWLNAIGIELPGASLAPLRAIEDEWVVPDEAALALIEADWPASDADEFGEECWVLTLSPDGLAALDEARKKPGGKDDGVTTETARIAIGKETSYWRGVYLTMSHPEKPGGPWHVDARVPTIAAGIEIEDESFTWEAPEGVKVVTWTPGSGKKAFGEFLAAMKGARQK
ncbi:MAG TPA: hypothetical protein QGH10_11455 [Armatimonadota bacterium]|nr:hypothetical protein [Armatimonadota bacterium]